jgi:aryl-alcohol dehydrogenase-like predicted oxidoreductase
MEYRRLGKSGLKVSEMGLGTNGYGLDVDEKTAVSLVDHALELGINFIDTAEMYNKGRSEEMVGKALKGKRSKVVLATKFGYPGTVGPADQRGSRGYLMKAVDLSLKRLDTDYIDLYYYHYPDPETPVEETLRAMDDLVHAGKVRYTGCSNFAAWQLCEALWTSRQYNLASFVVVQSRYNLIDRRIEAEVAPCCQANGVGVVPWGPLASGFLSGEYHRNEKISEGMRLAKPAPIYRDILTEANFDKLDKLEAFAREQNHTISELALAWLLSHPFLGSVIAGATNVEQLTRNMAALEWKLTAEDIARLDKIL